MRESTLTVIVLPRKWTPRAGLFAAALALVLVPLALAVAVAGLGVGVELVTRATELDLFVLSAEGTALAALAGLVAFWVGSRQPLRPVAALVVVVLLAIPTALAGILVLNHTLARVLGGAAAYAVAAGMAVTAAWGRRHRKRVVNIMGVGALLMAIAGLGTALAVAAVEVEARPAPRVNTTITVTRGELTGAQQRELDELLEQLKNSDNGSDRAFGVALAGAVAAGITPAVVSFLGQTFGRTGTSLVGKALGFVAGVVGGALAKAKVGINGEFAFSPTFEIKDPHVSFGGLKLTVGRRPVIRVRTPRPIVQCESYCPAPPVQTCPDGSELPCTP